jgi:hypothetical protein
MAKCRVSYTNEQGVHSVEVTADTLFEAVALAVAEFCDDKTVAAARPGDRVLGIDPAKARGAFHSVAEGSGVGAAVESRRSS